MTRLRPLETDGRAVAVVVGRLTVARVPTDEARRLDIHAGCAWTVELAAALHGPAKRHAAEAHALRLLATRARTSRELRRRLTLAGHAEADARAVVDTLVEAGLINDEQLAELAADHLADRRGLSRRGIEIKLRQRGIEGSTAQRIAREVRSAEDDSSAARELAAARLRRLTRVDDPEAVRRRLAGYLLRRGFEHEDVARAVSEAWRRHRDQTDLD
ncbi:MAG: regulatory protein RecX [Phycisphaerales bacterium]